jgi:hypothetical protein
MWPSVFGDLLGLRSQRRVDALHKLRRHMVSASVGDGLAQVGLEHEGVPARSTLVEMQGDPAPALVGQLTVEEEVEATYRLLAIQSRARALHSTFHG